MIPLKHSETIIGHIRIDKEMKAWPKGERLRQAILHKNLPPLTRMYAIKTETGIFKIVSSLDPRHPAYQKEFNTYEQMKQFIRKIGATLYSVPEEVFKKLREEEVSMRDRFYWESEMKVYHNLTHGRARCLIYERGNPDPIASCVDVNIAEKVVATLNKAHKEGTL